MTVAKAEGRPGRPSVASALQWAGRAFDSLERRWYRVAGHRVLGGFLVGTFIAALGLIELNRRGLLPPPLDAALPRTHFGAVSIAFTLLLVIEIFALVFTLAGSVANSLGRQFELLSLILVRKAFIAFGAFPEPIAWASVSAALPVILADLAGALAVFVLVGVYYRVQRHQRITLDEREQASFVAAKKAVALVLAAAFALLVARAAWDWLSGRPPRGVFDVFYTVLIFSDVLLVLISLGYGTGYHVVFRNTGFAAATVMIRLALTAPAYLNALLAAAAAGFAVAVTLIYNSFAPVIPRPGALARRAGDLR